MTNKKKGSKFKISQISYKIKDTQKPKMDF